MNPPIFVFSLPWFIFLAVLAALGVGLYGIGRRLDEAGKRKLLVGATLANLACFGLYMFGLVTQSHFPAYVVYDMPLQLCSLVTFSLIPAIVLRLKWLRGFCYFIGCLAGFLALFSPATGIEGVGVLTPLSIGFFGSHGLNVVIGALIAALGLYRPSYREAFRTLGFFGLLVAVMALVNVGVRATVLAQANYFYFFDPEGAGILVALHNLIGLPILYLAPVAPVIVPVLLLQAAIYRGGSRLATRLSRRHSPPQVASATT
ncbi:MAG: YwaF family protein [Bifidobacteriaceae bacterium]|nr:YwaF family protein [Bifidobacteriaceae bacterium]